MVFLKNITKHVLKRINKFTQWLSEIRTEENTSQHTWDLCSRKNVIAKLDEKNHTPEKKLHTRIAHELKHKNPRHIRSNNAETELQPWPREMYSGYSIFENQSV